VMLWEGRKLLLSKRLNTGFKDGLFGLPGGHLNPGESPIAAAVREVRSMGCTKYLRCFIYVRFSSDVSSLVNETSERIGYFMCERFCAKYTARKHRHEHTHKHTNAHT
jgi:hypothetical protein